jgi:cell division protein FtsL
VYEQPNELVESDKVDYRVIHQAHPTEQKSFLQPLKGLTCWQMVLYFLLVTIVIFSLVVIVIQANQIATLQTDNASLHGSISTLEAEKKALQGTITTLEAEKKALQGTITTLQAEINRLQTATPPPR